MRLADVTGAYTAERAAALSGVPRSTVHYWSRNDVLVPSVSPAKVKLWSYADLMGLRTIYWLRQNKVTTEGWDIPASTMQVVRAALKRLRELDMALFTEDGAPTVLVDDGGNIFVDLGDEGVERVDGARPIPDMLNLIEPFKTRTTTGPDLQRPRAHLRIVPGKLSGSPHVAHTRLETVTVASLRGRGFDHEKIRRLYPKVQPIALAEAIDLERQLSGNLRAAA
jgi:uncharacterized protein (DUF433 family)